MNMPLNLSWPPSVNHYWRHVLMKKKNGEAYVKDLISAEGRKYKRTIGQEVLAQYRGDVRTLEGRIRMAVVLYAPDRRRYDIDNRLKALLDALVDAHVMRDDDQVDEITIKRGPAVSGGMVRVWIQETQVQGKLA